MKTILTIFVMAASLNAFAQKRSVKDAVLVPVQSTEAEAVAAAEAMIPSILDGTQFDVNLTAHLNNCWVRKGTVVIRELAIKKNYVVGNEGTLVPSYRGVIRYELTDCN
ncbi:MAG: hypothetical protein H6624_14945 [Bdellovibrionaceae bacterium]|nr:hypothetical protein [Bdellovibrionales bacterium]MCB9085641.1 hypothetical protein [Pseudobdellovibrionaceae bacterium]